MGSFVMASSMVLPRLRQWVWLDGGLRSDAYCMAVSFSHGSAGSTASLEIPAMDWDGGKWSLRGVQVRVDVGYDDGTASTVFLGYLTTVEGGVSGNVVNASAVSILGLADTVYLGQGDAANDMVVEYPARALYRGVMRETGWTVASVLRDIFSGNPRTWKGGGGRLPGGWRSRLKLGSVGVLGSTYNTVPLGDMVFRQATLRDALDQLVGLVGTISFRERFEGFTTVLEFFELADPAAPLKTVVVARHGEAARESNVLDISHEEGADAVRTRVIALGDRRRFTVSVTTEHGTAPLEKDWAASLEAEVLAAPEFIEQQLGKNEVPEEWKRLRRRVFRRFRLPDCLRRVMIEDKLAVELSDGSRPTVQVWMWGRTAPVEVTEGSGTWTSEPALTPTLVEGVELHLAEGYFVLNRPAISFVSASIDGSGNIVDVYTPAVVGITLSLAGARLIHDTGVRQNGLSFQGIDGDGLVEAITNESFGFRQFSNVGFPVADGDGGEHVFSQTMVLLGSEWTLFDGAIITQDDGSVLRTFAQAALRERNTVRTTYTVTTPYWTSAYRLGDRIQVVGQNDHVFGTHQVLSLAYNLTNDHATTLSTDSSVPLIANQILEGGS
ncbi:hypothetical protein GC173_08185 [bacterium]|nr:hypothetical protein [bacterium]